MKNFLTILGIITASLTFGQSIEEYYNSVAYKYDRDIKYDKEGAKEMVKTAKCLVKKYNYDYKKLNEFKTVEEWEKETNLKAEEQLYIRGKFSQLMMGWYDRRIRFYNKFKKCLKKEDYDW